MSDGKKPPRHMPGVMYSINSMIEKIKSTSYAHKSVLISIVLIFTVISFFVLIHLILQNSMQDEHLALAMLIGSLLNYLLFITFIGAALGTVFGIVGFVKDKNRHLLAATGLSINAILLLVSVAGYFMSTR